MEGSQQSPTDPAAKPEESSGVNYDQAASLGHVWFSLARVLNKLHDIGHTLHLTLAEELDADRTRRARLEREAQERQAPR